MKTEKQAAWYDEVYNMGGHEGMYKLPAEKFPDRVIWNELLKRIPKYKPIVDMGCGVGMFAELCQLTGHNYAAGFDFSEVAIKEARKRVPGKRFDRVDFNSEDVGFQTTGYVFVFLEVLEHITEDLQLLSRVLPINKVFISVPNFDSESHVRHFEDMDDVWRRYGRMIEINYSKTFDMNDEHKIFLIGGFKK